MRTDTPFAAALTADQALETVGAALAGCPADAVEVTLLSRTAEYTRFAGDRIHQPQDITELTVSIKAVVDGHAARASTSSLARIGDTARLAARLAAQRAKAATGSGHALLARPEAVPDLRLWHEDTVAFDAAARVELAGLAMKEARAVDGRSTGMFGRAITQIAVGNSAGVLQHAEATEAGAALTVTVDDGTAHWIDLHRSADGLGTRANILSAVQRAVDGRGRVPMPDGEHTVVLGPEAAGELVGFLGDLGFTGSLAAAGVGVCAREPGARRASELVTVADDALAAVGLPMPFDFEGTVKRSVPILTRGAVGEPVTDLATAAALGTASTGHAHIAREEVPAPVAANLVMAPGDQTEAELVAGVERGVYVERFWYTRLVDETASTITGVTRDACFLIEDGRLTQPVDTGRFTQSVLGLLETVDGVADSVRSQPVMNVWNGCVSAPAIRGHGFRFGNRAQEVRPT
jgi:PmbA protein